MHMAAIGCAVLAAAAAGFSLLGMLALRSWRRQAQPRVAFTPFVSILKPLKGCDAEMFACFRSHCQQSYPEYELIFGVNTADDPAIPFVRRLEKEFPARKISLKVCDRAEGANRKVGNLVVMAAAAQGEYLIINDSDIRVPADYLASVMAWFADPQVGMVTCPYVGRAGKSLWSRLEALGILGDFMPGAMAARLLEGGVGFGLGSTLAVARSALAEIGGLPPLRDYLADDYELGSRIRKSGRKVVLAPTVVETMLDALDGRRFWQHQLRWGRTVRSSRRAGHAGLFLTFGLPWAVLAMLFSSFADWSWVLLGVVLVLRGATLAAFGRALGDRHWPRLLPLMPIADLIRPVIWAGSLFGSQIVWRGEVFHLQGGRLTRRGR